MQREVEMTDQKRTQPNSKSADPNKQGTPDYGERSGTNDAYKGTGSSQRDIGSFSSESGAYRGNYSAPEDPTNDVTRDPSQGGPYEGKVDNVRSQNNGPKERP